MFCCSYGGTPIADSTVALRKRGVGLVRELNLRRVRSLKMRIASLTILCLALAAIPALAQTYDNGPINGTTDAWTINFGYIVSDTFSVQNSGGTVTGFSIGVWEFPGDTGTSVDWSITSGENGGTVYGSGTAAVTDTFISSNQFGYNIDRWTATGLSVAGLGGVGNSYWLNLQNAVVPSGDPVYWDENSGANCGGINGEGNPCPALASESAVGTIPSEAFTVNYSSGAPPSTPEPSSIMLFGSGILGLAGLLRRKLF